MVIANPVKINSTIEGANEGTNPGEPMAAPVTTM